MIPEVPAISVADFKNLRNSDELYFMIDVRRDDEWEGGHFREAMHIPLPELREKIEQVFPDKTAPIIVYCAHGVRGATGTKTLQNLGYTNVRNLEGGYSGYRTFLGAE